MVLLAGISYRDIYFSGIVRAGFLFFGGKLERVKSECKDGF